MAATILKEAYTNPVTYKLRFNHATQCPSCGCEFVFKMNDNRCVCNACFCIFKISSGVIREAA